jgi:hypothetical protein
VRREDQSGTGIDYSLVFVSTIAQCHPCLVQLLTVRVGMIRCRELFRLCGDDHSRLLVEFDGAELSGKRYRNLLHFNDGEFLGASCRDKTETW